MILSPGIKSCTTEHVAGWNVVTRNANNQEPVKQQDQLIPGPESKRGWAQTWKNELGLISIENPVFTISRPQKWEPGSFFIKNGHGSFRVTQRDADAQLAVTVQPLPPPRATREAVLPGSI